LMGSSLSQEFEALVAILDQESLAVVDLDLLERQVIDWQRRAVDPSIADGLLSEIRERAARLRSQADLQVIDAYLRGEAYESALDMLQRRVDGGRGLPPDPDVRLRYALLRWRRADAAPVKEIDRYIQALVKDEQVLAVEALLTDGVYDQDLRGREALYWLSRKQDRPVVAANLAWLVERLGRRQKELRHHKVKAELDHGVALIRDRIQGLTQATSVQKVRHAYEETAKALTELETRLRPAALDDRQALEAMAWLSTGAGRVAGFVAQAQAVRGSSQYQDYLGRAHWMDPSHPGLAALAGGDREPFEDLAAALDDLGRVWRPYASSLQQKAALGVVHECVAGSSDLQHLIGHLTVGDRSRAPRETPPSSAPATLPRAPSGKAPPISKVWLIVSFMLAALGVLGLLMAIVYGLSVQRLAEQPPVTADRMTPSAPIVAGETPESEALPILDFDLTYWRQTCWLAQAALQEEAWEQALTAVETAQEQDPEGFVATTDCDLEALVSEVGAALSREAYAAEEYGEAGAAAARSLALLRALEGDDSEAACPFRDLAMLHTCAAIQRAKGEDEAVLAAAREALAGLASCEGTPRFYNDFSQLCGMSYGDAQASVALPTPALPTPEPSPRPTLLVRPTSEDVQGGATPQVCRPQLPTLIRPGPEATLNAGLAGVTFLWEGGALCDGQVWVVTFDGVADRCEATTGQQATCILPDWADQVTWRVEVWENGQPVPGAMTGGRVLYLHVDACAGDRDGDGVNNCKDKCPDEKGPSRTDGCPDR
jgi:hypothetical protein